MQPGRGADCDMMDEDYGGKDQDDDVTGSPKRREHRPSAHTHTITRMNA